MVFKTTTVLFLLWTFLSLSVQAHDNQFETISTDPRGMRWKKVLYSEGLIPIEQKQSWTLVEFPVDLKGRPLKNFLPTLLFHQKLALSGKSDEMISWMQSFRRSEVRNPSTMAVTDNPLWPIKKESWDASDEDLYEQWLQKNGGGTLLVGSGIEADCADYALALRWIFAYEHGLPAAQTLPGSESLWGSWQSTTEWDSLPSHIDWRQNKRFKAALRYLFLTTYTHSLRKDFYPVQINSQFVRAGTVYLTLAPQSGHTRTIVNVGSDPRCRDQLRCILVNWGDEPASQYGFLSDCDAFFIKESAGGFVRFRWPEKINGQWRLRAGTQMPGFSKEQYSWNEMNYFLNLNSRLTIWPTLEDQAVAVSQAVAYAIYYRQLTVNMGYYLCSVIACSPDSVLYETYSTPVRDHNIKQYFNSVKGFLKSIGDSPAQQLIQQRLEYSILLANHPLTYFQLAVNKDWSLLSSDPTRSFWARWDVEPVDTTESLQILARVMMSNWQNRAEIVAIAQRLCFKNGPGSAVTCNPQDPSVRELNTTRLDQAFRIQKKTLAQQIQALSTSEYENIRNDFLALKSLDQTRNAWDLIMTDSTFEQMTSQPTDIWGSRMGVF